MGNQTSRAIERKRESRRIRRRSTVTLGAQSHTSQGNYNWIDENTATSLSANGINAALAAAAAQQQSSTAAVTQEPPRRKSITEFFTKRKMSFSRPTEEDYREYDRMQRQHYLLKSARKANSWVPIDASSEKTFVDVGTGNGIWALEMATQHSHAQVLGLDIRLPPEQTLASLKNLRFVRTDIHERWPLTDAAVDLIFQRNMGPHVKKQQWLALLQEMYRVLKPGGYVELLELDPCHHNPGPVQKTFEEFARSHWEEFELDFEFIGAVKGYLEEAGFELVEQRQVDIPIGEWPEESELKQFGFINKETQKAFLRNRKQELISKWGIPSEDYDLAVQEIMEEFEEYHSFSRFTCWIVKKPL
ncbi:S-adenosyl-L-methionine-dependent methyltransferase [Zychaea mexicana]|uniref:S-adenosyl-L-methionine-dependent methyltransferase n=1 Tax=Zychaea mexicana TaxID=64656 RepID=UPI0022FDDFAE|nr:S-adenosyl-L-methionine-dependent methyltransferase [Zychaea mexicana]KAI9495908.1 S-adenosyl-L-methionine-dependent methyltransferase [Zychaea mexicana]